MKRLFGCMGRRLVSPRSALTVAAVIAALVAPSLATAADIVFNGGTTNWDTAANWNGGALPGAADNALVNGGLTADINASLTNGTVTGVYIGSDGPAPTATAGNGTVLQHAQTLNVSGTLKAGGAAGRTGTYTISGGTLSAATMIMGDLGTGNFNQSGASFVTSANDVNFGNQAGSTGNFTISGGTFLADSTGANFAHPNRRLVIGSFGTGSGTQTGGNVYVNRLNIGRNAGGVGTYTLSGGQIYVDRNLSVGTSSQVAGVDTAGTGYYIQTGGTFINEDDFVAGDNPNGIGTIDVSGGTAILRGTHSTESGNIIPAYDPGTVGNITIRGTAQVETISHTSIRATTAGGLPRLTGGDLDGSVIAAFDAADAGHAAANGTLNIGTLGGGSQPNLKLAGNIIVAQEGNAVVNHNGGLTQVGLTADPSFTTDFQGNAIAFDNRGTADEGGDVVIGVVSGSRGTFNLAGGTLDVRYGGIYGGAGAAEDTSASGFKWTGGDLRIQEYNGAQVTGAPNALGLRLTQGGTTGGGSTLWVDGNLPAAVTTVSVFAAYRMAGGTTNIVVDNGKTLSIFTDTGITNRDDENAGLQIGVGAGNNATVTVKNNSILNVEHIDMMRNDPLGGAGTSSGTAVLNLSDTSQINLVKNGSNGGMRIGVEGDGVATLNQTGGVITTDEDTWVGDRGGHGAYNMSGGTYTTGVSADLTVGGTGTGTMSQTGNALVNNPLGTIYVGRTAGGAGTYDYQVNNNTATGGGIITGQIEAGDNGNGLFTQGNAGTHVGGAIAIGANLAITTGHAGSGTYNMNGGVNVVGLADLGGGGNPAGSIAVGYEGLAVFNMTGGTNNLGVGAVTIQGTVIPAVPTPHTNEFVPQFLADGGTIANVSDALFVVGTLENSNGTMNQSGGTNNIGGNIIIGYAGASGTYPASQGVWNQTGGSNFVGVSTGGGGSNPGGDLLLGVSPGTKGAYNLKGGLLDVTKGGGRIALGVGKATGGSAAFNFTGGTLKVINMDDPVLIDALAGAGTSAAVNLGGLSQKNSDNPSLLDASGNNTKIWHNYTLAGGTATVGAGKTIDVVGKVTVNAPASAGNGANYFKGAGTINAINGFNVSAGVTLNYDGVPQPLPTDPKVGILNIAGAQVHGAGSILKVNGGTVNLNSVPFTGSGVIGPLTVTIDPAKVHFNAPKGNKITALSISTGSTADLKQNGAPTFSQAGSPYGYIGSDKYLGTTTFSVAGTGQMDMTNNTMVVNYGGGANPLAAITAAIKSGAAVSGGVPAWNGPGINSSTAAGDYAANPGNGLTALGVLDNGDAAVNPGYVSITDGGDFSTAVAGTGSSTLPANSVLVKMTYLGDTQLAGKVQFSDFLVWKAAFSANLAGGHVGGWAHAQFDYGASQTVFADFLVWKNSFSKTLSGLLPNLHSSSVSGLGTTAVPEPSSLVLLAIGGVAALWIRRRRVSK